MHSHAIAAGCTAGRIVPILLPVLLATAACSSVCARDQPPLSAPAFVTKLPAEARMLTRPPGQFLGPPAGAGVPVFSETPLEPVAVYLRPSGGSVVITPDPAGSNQSRHNVKSADETVVVMKPFVVTRSPVRLVFPPRSNRLLEAVKTGILYRHTGRILAGDVVAYGEPGPGGYGRIKIGLSFSW